MTGAAPVDLEGLENALAAHGLFTRGIVNFDADEPAPPVADGSKAASVVLVGAVGGSLWPHFSVWRSGQDRGLAHPLDTWSKEIIGAVAATFGAAACFPSDRPWQPFQRWAMRAEGLMPSPLGILIHPVYGLWHSYRGALVFGVPLPVPETTIHQSPCATCRDQPCKTPCPASAVTDTGFDVAACRSVLKREEQGAACRHGGCFSRNACPVGASLRYSDTQLGFHMAAIDPQAFG